MDEILDQLETHLEKGKILTAWNLAQPLGNLASWAPGRAMSIASRIASGSGNDRLASVLDWQNWRMDRSHPERYFLSLFARLRWKAAVEFLPEIQSKIKEFDGVMDDEVHSDLLTLETWSLASLRDFQSAHASIQAALKLTPKRSWTHVQLSSLLEAEDRYEEALQAAKQSLGMSHFYKPSVMQTVNCLIHLGRDDEAIRLLRQAHENTEQGAFVLRLQALYSEREDHQSALWCLDEAERLMPMMTTKVKSWLAGRRADFLYMSGDYDGCLACCDHKELGFQQQTAENLRRPGAFERKRVRLDVPFIRQHRMTCAPATLASLAKFWDREHEHLDIAELICYNGTPWHKERQWAESNDFIAKEFRFTKTILIELIDRGIPFTLTTTAVTSAHLQACIGYDDRQGTALLRDPTNRHFGEVMIEGLINAHPVQGPRCMLLVPTEKASLLDELILPDELLYEARHRLAQAMEKHDRWKAEEAVSTMRAIDPEHSLTLFSRFEFASYLGHRAVQLELIDSLSKRFPTSELLQSQRLYVLQQMGDRLGADQLLERVLAQRGCDPMFVSKRGEFLLEDARQLRLAGTYLRRAVRLQRSDSQALESLARWHDKTGDFPEAARLRHYASNLSPTWEPYARGYFDSCWSIGQVEQGLTFLKKRVDQLGRTRSDPWMTYASALESIQRSEEARSTLEQAVSLFPNDGELRLRAGRMMMGWGEADRSIGLSWIEAARGQVAEAYWLRQRAGAAIFVGDRVLAIRLWRNLLGMEPTAIDAYQSLVQLIAEETGETEALAFLEEATRCQLRNTALWGLLAHWRKQPAKALLALDRLLDLDPHDLWARRERAIKRFDLDDRVGGLADAWDALARNPREPQSFGILAMLSHRNGDDEVARSKIREALQLNIDYTVAIKKLVEWSPGIVAKQEAIAFIASEMRRQVSNGDSIREFQTQAWQVLSPPELLSSLQKFCEERPDLWQTWSAQLDQALQMDLFPEARECAEKLATAFPLQPTVWLEVAKVRHTENDITGELGALQKAVDLAPAWDLAARKLSEVLERLGRYDEAENVLKRAIRHEPLACINYGLLADLLLRRDKKKQAYDCLQLALGVGPYYLWGWTTCARLCIELSCEAEFLSRLAIQNDSHGHNFSWWTIAVDIHSTMGKPEEALKAAHAGLALSPEHSGLRDQLAVILCELSRYEEALAVCTPAPDSVIMDREITGRRAWVLMNAGDGPAAIQVMTELLEKEPDYVWGWSILSTWYISRTDWNNLFTAAKQWTRFCPDSSAAQGHLGLAAEKLDDNSLAKRAYERAFLLDPEYQFAGRKLFNLQIKNREYKEASKTLTTLRHYTPGSLVECDAITLALARNQDEEAFEIGVLHCLNSDDLSTIEWMNAKFSDWGLGLRWLGITEQIIKKTPTASAVLLSAWAGQAAKSDNLESAGRRLRKFKVSENSRNPAWEILLRAAGAKKLLPLMEKWIRKERARFLNDANLWNAVAELFLLAGMPKKTVTWLNGWEQRTDDVGSHTLVNLSAAVDTLKGPSYAVEIRNVGISRFRGEINAQSLRAGQATYLATLGRIQEAAEMLAPVEDSLLSRYYVGLAALGRSMVAASSGSEAEAETYYKAALEKLGIWSRDVSVRRYIKDTQTALSLSLPWANGSPRKVSKKWGRLSGSLMIFSSFDNYLFIFFGFALVIFCLVTLHLLQLLILLILIVYYFTKSSKYN